jgi:hypothetical protein
MIDDPEIVAERGISSAILKGFWDWCCQMDKDNRGSYNARLGAYDAPFLKNVIPTALRKGIAYYSKGHGWRVRKKPLWKTVFAERFPVHYARFTTGK